MYSCVHMDFCFDASLNVGGPGGTAGDGRLRGVSQAREAPVHGLLLRQKKEIAGRLRCVRVDAHLCAMIKRAWDRGVPVWVLMLAVLGGVAIFDSIFLRRSLPLSEPSGEAPDAAPPAVEREAAPAVWYEKTTAGEQRATGGTLDWGALERLGDLREAAAAAAPETRARRILTLKRR